MGCESFTYVTPCITVDNQVLDKCALYVCLQGGGTGLFRNVSIYETSLRRILTQGPCIRTPEVLFETTDRENNSALMLVSSLRRVPAASSPVPID